MALISIPASVGIRSVEWRQPQAFQTQRSAFSGWTRFAEIGTAHRWECDATFRRMPEPEARAFRAWMARFLRPGNHTRITIVEKPQSAIAATITQGAAGAFATQITYSGAPSSTLVVPAGGFASLPLAGGGWQAVSVIAESTSNASGAGVLQFAQPLRAANVAGAAIEVVRPFVELWPLDPLRWSVEPLPLYSAPVVTFEEAF